MEDNFGCPGMMDDVKFFRKNMFLFKHQKSKPTTSEYTPKSTYTQEFAFPSPAKLFRVPLPRHHFFSLIKRK